MLRNGFCMKPNKFADNIPQLFKMSKACVYVMYPRGQLTKEFIEKFHLEKVHLMPEDFAMVPPPKQGIKKYLTPLNTPAKNTKAAASADPKVQAPPNDANKVTPATGNKLPKDTTTSAAAAGAQKVLNMGQPKGATKPAAASAPAKVLNMAHQGANYLEDTDDESVGRQRKKQKVGTNTNGMVDESLLVDSDDNEDSIFEFTDQDYQGHSLEHIQNLEQNSQEEECSQQNQEAYTEQQQDNEQNVEDNEQQAANEEREFK